MNSIKSFITLLFILFSLLGKISAQQNHSMFLMHYLPESNLLNPAVPITCKWYIGLPVLSSTHFNYGNSSFSYKQMFKPTGNGTYQANIEETVKRLHWRNYIGTELHTQLLGLGYRTGDYSFMFTITEKNNIPIFYPKQAIELAWQGNSQFEGQSAGLKGTGVFFNHYREYTLSASKYTRDGIYIGARAKLLFGKLNISPRSTDVSLTTDETTFDLFFDGKIEAHTSLPLIVESNNNLIEAVNFDNAVSPLSLLMNRKNPGFAMDLGIIYPVGDKIELSASAIDLGLIRWRSNLNTFRGSGNFFYNGPLGDTTNPENYANELLDAFTDSMEIDVTAEKYTTFLPPRLIAGGTYRINHYLKAGVQGQAIFHRSKVMPSATLSLHYEPIQSIQLMASYSIQYYSLKSLGFGIVLGRNPVQFYAVSDDLIGTIWPMAARNINLRFGLNINFGCKIKEKAPGSGKGMIQGNCFWLEKSIQNNLKRRERLRLK